MLCRARQELSHEYLVATIGFDTAENEPLKVWRSLEVIYSSPPSCDSFWLAAAPSPPGAVLSADLAPEREDVLDPERVVEEPEQHAFF